MFTGRSVAYLYASILLKLKWFLHKQTPPLRIMQVIDAELKSIDAELKSIDAELKSSQ